jgi:uncharacterized membrane protein
MNTNAPRSVEDYLRQLRAALEGQDPALIQDALYDAEEYLRAEIAAHAGKSEADVLELIASTYGAPEEVAAAYRDTEVKVAAALRAPPKPPATSLLGRFFGIFGDGRAYAGLLFMLFSLATGILYFTVTMVGTSLSIGLAVLIIGVPFFIAFIGVTRVLALVECRLVEAVSGVRMPRRPQHPGPPRNFWSRITDMLKDSRTWTTIGYNVLMLPVGIIYFTLAVVGVSVSLVFIAAPVLETVRALGGIDPDHWRPLADTLIDEPQWLTSPPGLSLCFVAGVLLLKLTLHVSRGIARGHATLAKSMLVLP